MYLITPHDIAALAETRRRDPALALSMAAQAGRQHDINATKPLEGRILDMTTDDIQVVLQPRNATIGELVEACAKGDLAFSGPDSLCAKVAAMGFKTTSLYEMVMAYRAALSPQP